ncbi:chymotrypsin-1-like [Cydia amplana]|uniref:chymotrypsin-1-like n=1 Tax=Cydia amplana TaxID=1869771 RepID=UPI002FE59C04
MPYRTSVFFYKITIYFQVNAVVCHIKDLGETKVDLLKAEILIAGGKPADLESYPWNVQFLNSGGMCAASILTQKTVLTAGHCFDFNKNIGDMSILAASRYIFDHHRQQHNVWDFRIHPDYNTSAIFSDDIAIIFIEDMFLFDRHVKPAKLVNTDRWMRETGTTFTATGWGQTSEDGELSLRGLMEAKLRFIPRKECLKEYEGVIFSHDMFCLYGNGTSDTCKGDSGGGILWNNMIVGIVSHGKGCLKYPGVYSNVYYYTGWIKNITQELFQKYCRFQSFG